MQKYRFVIDIHFVALPVWEGYRRQHFITDDEFMKTARVLLLFKIVNNWMVQATVVGNGLVDNTEYKKASKAMEANYKF